jgi:hypothetical protein
LRRSRQFDEAAACWQQLLDMRGCPPAVTREAAEALAIHHEHRLQNLTGARTFAERSLDPGSGPTWTNAVQHRLARIDRKLEALESRNAQLELTAES